MTPIEIQIESLKFSLKRLEYVKQDLFNSKVQQHIINEVNHTIQALANEISRLEKEYYGV